MSTLTEKMRDILEMEDRLAASAREELASARRAAQQAQKGASDASESVAAAALRTYEIARDMRTRTRQSLAAAQSAVSSISDGATETLARVADEVQVRAADARTFANRLIEEARKLSSRLS